MSELPMLTVVLPGMCLFGILDTEPRSLQALLLVLVFAIAVGGDTFAYFVGSAHWRAQAVPAHQPQQNRGRSCRRAGGQHFVRGGRRPHLYAVLS